MPFFSIKVELLKEMSYPSLTIKSLQAYKIELYALLQENKVHLVFPLYLL